MTPKTEFLIILQKKAAAANINLTETQQNHFFAYYQALVTTNEHLNLTAITEAHEVAEKHFIDSLLPISADIIHDGMVCIDVGTGAGFPGVPLAIMYPNVRFVLMDALQKRLHFLDELTQDLGLRNIETLHARAEDAAKGKYREQFDLVLSRAVAPLAVLAEFCLPFTKIGGMTVAYKSRSAQEELNQAAHAITVLGGGSPTIFGSEERNLILIPKSSPTPQQYPRKAGTPTKKTALKYSVPIRLFRSGRFLRFASITRNSKGKASTGIHPIYFS